MKAYLTHIVPDFFLQYFPIDKILHFFSSFILLFIFYGIRKYFLKEEGFLRIFAFSFRDVIIVGVFKEILDLFGFGNPEVMDLVANLTGLVVPIYLFFIFQFSSLLNNSHTLKFEKDLISKFKHRKNVYIQLKLFIKLGIIWFFNIFYLFIKILILALDSTYLLLVKIIKKI